MNTSVIFVSKSVLKPGVTNEKRESERSCCKGLNGLFYPSTGQHNQLSFFSFSSVRIIVIIIIIIGVILGTAGINGEITVTAA